MGQKNSHPEGANTSTTTAQVPVTQANFNPEVEVLQKTYDPHYGEIKLVRDVKTAEKFVLKEITVNTKQAFETEQNFFNNRVALKHPNVVNIIGYNSQDKHNFCSTYYKLSLFLENLEQNLKTDLDARKEVNNPYTDSELLFIADDLIAGLSYFQNQGVSHGDIRPLNVFVKDGIYKLSDPSLNAQKGSNALTHAIVQGTKTLLSPILVKHVPQNKFDLTGDQYKNDVYSLGATLLSLATLTDSEDLYDYAKGTVNETLVTERLETVQRNRNPLTHELIKNMLSVEESGRPDFVTLSNRILPHRDQIRSGTYGGLNQGSTIDYLYGKTEQVKRSALPQDDTLNRAERQLADSRAVLNTNTYTYQTTTNAGTDDLEAKIRAALERSEATFRAVNTGSTGASSYPAGSYQGTTTTTTNYGYTNTADVGTTNYGYTSTVDAGATNYSVGAGTTGYSATAGTDIDALKKSSTPAPASYTYTSSTYTPSSYNYTATGTTATDANAGTAGAYTSGTAGSYGTTYTPNTYSSGTYGQTGAYTSGGYSSYVPASTYTTYSHSADVAGNKTSGTGTVEGTNTFSDSTNQYGNQTTA